ncbi:Cytochrome P450 [Dillenia turbinata]|uniref:Cytochrome P450 n=1 Tax=Dillenia turbinata TaxID=194707 RepID=A0AAN8ZIJ8_9MAGN
MEGTIYYSPFLLLLPLLFLVAKYFNPWKPSKSLPLPPGPYPWPIIGNILSMGNKPRHVTLTQLAKSYGPLISLRFGSQLLIVGSSADVAMEILKTNDQIFSARYVPQAIAPKISEIETLPVGWTPECNDRWKYIRSFLQVELFSGKALKTQACRREKRVMDMLEFIRSMEGNPVHIGELMFAVVYNLMGAVLLSRDIVNLKDGSMNGEVIRLVRAVMESGAAPNISDFFPFLAGLDLQSIRKRRKELRSKLLRIWSPIIKQRRETRKEAEALSKDDFLDAMISNNFTDAQINSTLLELFGAGSDSSATTIGWAMAELVRNPEVMKKVREEVSKECYQNVVPEEVVTQFPYLQACIKETLRLHPPGPFILPHRALKTCQVMNYTIPKNSLVSVNIWAIGRDPAYWEDPLSFKPERFLNSKLEFLGNDFEYIPFSAGRRICPGLPMAAKMVPLVLSNLIHFFDWVLPDGIKPNDLDMSEKAQFLVQKNEPLNVIPKARK